MKIGIDARLWNQTGVGRYIRNLVKNLIEIDSHNNYVLFALEKDVSSIKYYVSSKNLKVVGVYIRWHSVKEQVQFTKILNKEELDLVHFPYFSVPILYKRPFIVTIHDLIVNHYPTGKASTLPLPLYYFKLLGYKFVVRNAIQNAKKIISVSNTTKKEILDHYKVNPDKIAVTYEGVGERVKGKAERGKDEEKKLNASPLTLPPYFLYVGNAYPHKNLMLMLRAFANLKFEILNFKLIMVGKEDYFYKQLKEKVRTLGLEDRVEFKGYVSDAELEKLYQNARAVIIPSFMEGFSLPGLEAMSRDCLVIASDIPVHKEIFKDAAVYFKPTNTSDLVEKLKSVYSYYNSYKSYITKGSTRVKDFSWEKMAEETLVVYNSVS